MESPAGGASSEAKRGGHRASSGAAYAEVENAFTLAKTGGIRYNCKAWGLSRMSRIEGSDWACAAGRILHEVDACPGLQNSCFKALGFSRRMLAERVTL